MATISKRAADAIRWQMLETGTDADKLASAVLEAIRKPTEAMKDRGLEQFDFDECGDDAFHKRICGRVFEAMIDAAINDDATPLTGATP